MAPMPFSNRIGMSERVTPGTSRSGNVILRFTPKKSSSAWVWLMPNSMRLGSYAASSELKGKADHVKTPRSIAELHAYVYNVMHNTHKSEKENARI